jgi:murein DD-endopeptidase MepM/ murein hydrolase activator NlpD
LSRVFIVKIILIDKHLGGTKTLTLGTSAKVGLFVVVVLMPLVALASLIWQWRSFSEPTFLNPDVSKAWRHSLDHQDDAIQTLREEAQTKLEALTIRVAELQARLLRLDALGERITVAAKLEAGEFDFSSPPAQGGPAEEIDDHPMDVVTFMDMIDDLALKIDDRQHQLQTLESLLANEKLADARFLAGRPVKQGYLSSPFGRRMDPITGKSAMHAGVDFAGPIGSEIIAVADGVVTWSAEHYTYGNMVEINHGNGFTTRYAHCKKNLVKVGDVVKKGQNIALMGNRGRSTGPHVHFEVYKHGRVVNPASYIHRASR